MGGGEVGDQEEVDEVLDPGALLFLWDVGRGVFDRTPFIGPPDLPLVVWAWGFGILRRERGGFDV